MQNQIKIPESRLYVTIAALIRKRIHSGILSPGERLPSHAALAKKYEVAVVTIRQAIGVLESEGLLRRQQGSGTFVADTVEPKRWITLETGWNDLLRMVETSKVKMIRVDDEVQSPTLFENEGTPAPAYRFMRRIHLASEVPYAILDIFIDRRLYQRAPSRFDSEMIIRLLDSMEDVDIASARQRLTIESADFEVSEMLNLAPGAPVGQVRRVICDRNGTAIYIGLATYRGDMVRLERDLMTGRERKDR